MKIDDQKPCQSAQLGLNDAELLSLRKPAQYLGGEQNSILKTDQEIDVNFALAFPDTYEVGMSHLGLQILYDVINRDERAWAERVFMPFPDMEELLAEKNLPLTSLESKRSLKEFDAIGFTLQYELCATNILAMLDLSGIPFFAAERTAEAPLIIGGGPYSYHPEAVAPFFDAFLLGDAEEAIFELLDVIRTFREQRNNGDTKARENAIAALHRIEGVYVPSMFEPVYAEDGTLERVDALDSEKSQVVRRLLPSLEGAPYPEKPITPNVRTVHNRLSVEVMRGCVRGCRFCQAGYLYRPQRERSPQEIVEMVGKTLPETGFEEVSLLSLSTADYCSVVPLLKQMMDIYGEQDRTAISFPSTRVDALTPEVLEQVQRVRRTNFTVAPEAGTQRLRDVINKGVSDEQILETARNVFTMGWTGIKLYFMLGLPTETDEDLQGIVETARSIKALPEAKGKSITVSVSTHVPKPHTPFQWAQQISAEETVRRQRLLATGLREVGVNFRYHDAFSSVLEGVFCRADRRLATVICRAYELGCRLDAWSEFASEELWNQAFFDCNIDPLYFLRERAVEEPLPWDHLSCGIPKRYFAKEWKRATRDKTTPDCLTASCSVCGACDYDSAKNVLWQREKTEDFFSTVAQPKRLSLPETAVSRVRLVYEKKEAFRFVGHLELAHVFHRAVRRSSLPIAYSQGFHPMQRLSFGPPLQLGIASETEMVDLHLVQNLEPELVREFLNQALPEGVSVSAAWEIPLRSPSLQDTIESQRYRVHWLSPPRGILAELISQPEDDVVLQKIRSAVVTRKEFKKKGRRRTTRERNFTLGDFLSKESLSSNGTIPDFEFSLRMGKEAGPRPLEIVRELSELAVGEYFIEKIETSFAVEKSEHRNELGHQAASACH